MSQLEQKLASAIEKHRAGDLDEAERLYREVISAAPDAVGAVVGRGRTG